MKRTLPILLSTLLMLRLSTAAQPADTAEAPVRNVILMIGDGMGLAQVAAWMIENRYEPIAFDRAQYTALCKTYSANNRITDSGASATAMATGVKTRNSWIGTDPAGNSRENLTELAKAKGLATGIVVTSYLADATPAAFTAHTNDRHNTSAIVQGIVRLKPDVIAGGGLSYFERQEDGSYPLEELQKAGYSYVATPEEFYAIDRTPLIGLFAEKYMPEASRRDSAYLARTTAHTLELLGKHSAGFFAMIEGSQIDGACHENNASRMIDEMRDFDRAVNVAFDFADTHPGTLVLVVADHETGGLTIISNDRDFTASESGIQYNYSTTSHSGSPVILYAYGTGAANFSGVLENTDIFRRVKALLIDAN